MVKRPLRSELATLLISALLLAFYNYPFWTKLVAFVDPIAPRDWGFIAIAGLLVLAYYNLVLGLFASRYVFKPLVIVLLILSSFVTYFMNQYGVMIDARMVQNVMETNSAESLDLLTTKMAGYVVVLGLIPSWLVWKLPVQWRPFWRELGVRLLSTLGSIVVILAIAMMFYQEFASLFRNHREIRLLLIPSNALQATWGYVNDTYLTRPVVVEGLGRDAKKGPAWQQRKRRSLTVIVVGETARADNFGLNGYSRDTTPRLRNVPGLVNLSNIWSCGTETAVSLPCMFSNLTRENYSDSKAKGQEGLLDVLTHAGFAVQWRDNQSGCKGVCDRVPTVSTTDLAIPAFCDTECHDEILLHGVKEQVEKSDKDMVVVLHMMGSHGPAYFQRYPAAFEKWKPVCKTSQLDRCDRQSIINGYDNTILYTDYVLARTIEFLKSQPGLDTAMLYMSDHGESLGENGMYLHGTPYFVAPDQQKHIAATLWLSEAFAQDFRIDTRCLKDNSAKPFSHDNLFHSVLGMLDVSTSVYRPALDMFAPCRTAR